MTSCFLRILIKMCIMNHIYSLHKHKRLHLTSKRWITVKSLNNYKSYPEIENTIGWVVSEILTDKQNLILPLYNDTAFKFLDIFKPAWDIFKAYLNGPVNSKIFKDWQRTNYFIFLTICFASTGGWGRLENSTKPPKALMKLPWRV